MILKPEGTKKISVIESIRGLAALSVCLFHFTKANLEFVGYTRYIKSIFSWGWLGVEAFFVLSGFIIVYSLVKSRYRLNLFFKFLLKRSLRIEPPYLVSILLVIILGFISTKVPGFKGADFNISLPQVISHVAYLPEHFGFKWLLPVYWSLEAEFHYYILIGLFLPFLWKNEVVLYSGLFLGLALSYHIQLYVFSYMPLFVMGIATAAFMLAKIKGLPLIFILCACFAVSLHREQPIAMPIVGVTTSLAILFIKKVDIFTQFLGSISFSLYLLHVPIGGRILNYAGRYADTELKTLLALAIALFITIVFSWVFYKLIEYPSILLSKRINYKN